MSWIFTFQTQPVEIGAIDKVSIYSGCWTVRLLSKLLNVGGFRGWDLGGGCGGLLFCGEGGWRGCKGWGEGEGSTSCWFLLINNSIREILLWSISSSFTWIEVAITYFYKRWLIIQSLPALKSNRVSFVLVSFIFNN